VGRFVQSTLLVGHPYGVAALHQQLLRRPLRDYQVIGCCLPPPGRVGATLHGLPVLGGPDDVVDVVCRYGVDTVAVLPSSGLDGAALRRLGSDLEPTRADLLLAPAMPGTGEPHVWHHPSLGGVHGLVKASLDRTVAGLVLVLLAPLLIGVAVWLKATNRGPVFVRQERMGRNGQVFHLLKFRTEADAGRTGPGGSRVGSALRHYSIDELPQLFNVLTGDMSLVGPRPEPPSEVARSGADVRCRLPVKPGLVGLRQVLGGQGRSAGDDGLVDVVEVDVDEYAENWSLSRDVRILGRALMAALLEEAPP
jgi:lipopolysaccharide/colanic/teichoic acid biosynthesis glycosyltransferase